MDRRNGLLVRSMLCGGALLSLAVTPAAAQANDPIGDVQQAVAAWAKVRTETVRIESDWEWQRTLMQSTLDALTERVGQLEAKRDELLAKTAAERRETAELTERRQQMEAAAAQASSHLRALDDRLVQMRGWLPPRLSTALELPYRSLAERDLPVGERMQHTMAILNRCTLFNRAVSCGEEMVVSAGGEPKLMQVVYWGLAHGYALDRAARTAYFGAPGDSGWTWTAAPELTDSIERLIAVAEDKREPELVPALVQVADPAALVSQR